MSDETKPGVDTKFPGQKRRLAKSYKRVAVSGKRRRRAWSVTIDLLVQLHADLVRRLARRFARGTGAALDLEDLVSVGIIGLIDAYRNYDPAGGRPFRVYAEFRVRGQILDELRRLDPLSQPMRRKARRLRNAGVELAAKLSRDPTEQELAEHVEISIDDVRKWRRETNVLFVAIDRPDMPDIRSDLARSTVAATDLKILVSEALERLPEREQHVVSLYYFHDMTLREIGDTLSLTEARICQIHKAAVKRMRRFLEADGAV